MDVSIIRNTIKNFLKNSLYLFIPMGIVYFAILIAAFGFISSTVSNLTQTVNAFSKLISESIEDSSVSVVDFLEHAAGQINWNGNFFDTLKQILDTDWIQNTLKGFFDTLGASSETFDVEVDNIISSFVFNIQVRLSLAITICVIGMELANVATRFVLRRKTAKRNIKQLVIAHTLVPLFHWAVLVTSVTLIYFFKWAAIIGFIALILISTAVSLINSWLIYRNKSLSLKEVLTTKNVMSELASVMIIFVFDLLLLLALLSTNTIAAILIMVPFLIYSFNIIELNTDSYVCALVASKSKQFYGEMLFENER